LDLGLDFLRDVVRSAHFSYVTLITQIEHFSCGVVRAKICMTLRVLRRTAVVTDLQRVPKGAAFKGGGPFILSAQQ
jgi:hypothetical protein